MHTFLTSLGEEQAFPVGHLYRANASLGTGKLWFFEGEHFYFMHYDLHLNEPYPLHLPGRYALLLQDQHVSTVELTNLQLYQEKAILFIVDAHFLHYIESWYNLNPILTAQLFTLFSNEYSMELKSALEIIAHFLPTPTTATNYYKSKAYELMAILVYYGAKRQTPDRDALTRLHNFITMHFDQNLSLQDLASQWHMSKSKMTQDFKARYGISIGEYVQSLRLKRAKLLLHTSDEPMYVIAESLGFKRQSSFSEWFKKATGQTPVTYRKALSSS